MRTFQFSDAKSHKFWNIEVSGSSFTVTYGKIGASGQTQTKNFASVEKAQAEADKLIHEKLKKGYVETTPKTVVSTAEAFERALIANPDDLATASIYADYLMEQNDPRGEFIQVQIALEDESLSRTARAALKKQEAALLKKHEKDWLGSLAAVTVDAEPVPFWDGGKQGQRTPVAHRFSRGWLSRLEFHNLTVSQARALAQAPQARLLHELIVEDVEAEVPVGTTQQYISSYYEAGPDVPADLDAYEDPGLHALCRCPHLASIRLFQLGETVTQASGQEEEYFNCHTSGQLAYHLVKQMPNLEELYLLAHRVDANKIFSLPMPRLRVLQLYHSHSYPLDKLAANPSLTNLTALLCHPHAWDFDGEEEQGAYIRLPHLRAICRSPHLQTLTHLRLRLTNFGDAGAKEIVESGILKRLKVLDLQGGCITDEGARLLAGCPELKHLDYLNLSRNALTKAGEEAIAATGVQSTVSSQHGEASGDFGGGEIPEYLFEGDIE
ncbi:MAG TPA: WGR domain-containing protein [Gemmataceae bacterium]|nr:WGR domain-containing protein [Gemmataceae bacterium]